MLLVSHKFGRLSTGLRLCEAQQSRQSSASKPPTATNYGAANGFFQTHCAQYSAGSPDYLHALDIESQAIAVGRS
jgi:hypothetical protein